MIKQHALFNKFSDFLTLGLKQPELLFLLSQATKEHKQVEGKFKEMLSQCQCGRKALFPNGKLNLFEYFERNFFSILFLSIFNAVKIPKEKRMIYGVVVHAIRTIVTCTDNLLDKEKKGAVFLNLGLKNSILDNVILLLMSQRVLSQATKQASKDENTAEQIEGEIFDSLCSIAKGESLANVTNEITALPKPEDIIETIHKKIGGELLRLALIAPLKNEVEIHQQLGHMEAGVLDVGLALQMLDDVVDFSDDIIAGKINLLASWIIHRGSDGFYTYPELREKVQNSKEDIKNVFSVSRMEVINAAIDRALEGFEQLSCGGYPIDRSAATSVLGTMFRLRGLDMEWQLSDYAQ